MSTVPDSYIKQLTLLAFRKFRAAEYLQDTAHTTFLNQHRTIRLPVSGNTRDRVWRENEIRLQVNPFKGSAKNMHDWKMIARPWLGVRLYRCAECGHRVQLVGKELHNVLEALCHKATGSQKAHLHKGRQGPVLD